MQAEKDRLMLERIFGLAKAGTDLRTEFVAGMTTFLTMIYIVFVNPQILWQSDEKAVYEEGCLSIPEFYEEVERPAQVRVKFIDLDGKEQEIEASALLATCVQHEIDHLNGILFIDHISKLKRDRVIKKFAKAAKRGDEE